MGQMVEHTIINGPSKKEYEGVGEEELVSFTIQPPSGTGVTSIIHVVIMESGQETRGYSVTFGRDLVRITKYDSETGKGELTLESFASLAELLAQFN